MDCEIPEDHVILFAFDSADDLIKIGGGSSLIGQCEFRTEDRSLRNFVQYLNQQIIDKEMYYLLLDEVQNLEAFESVLNGFLRKKNMDVYVTGSNSKFLSKIF